MQSFPLFCIKSRVFALKQIVYLNSCKNMNGKYIDAFSGKQSAIQ